MALTVTRSMDFTELKQGRGNVYEIINFGWNLVVFLIAATTCCIGRNLLVSQ